MPRRDVMTVQVDYSDYYPGYVVHMKIKNVRDGLDFAYSKVVDSLTDIPSAISDGITMKQERYPNA